MRKSQHEQVTLHHKREVVQLPLEFCVTPHRDSLLLRMNGAFRVFSQWSYPWGCACRHFQASPIIVARSGLWGTHPSSPRIFWLEATRIGGSPARRGASTAWIGTPVTR